MGKRIDNDILQDIAVIINGKPILEKERIPVQAGAEEICLIQGSNLGLLENSRKWGLDLVDVDCYKKTKDTYINEVEIDDILLTGRGSEVHVARFPSKMADENNRKHYLAGKNLFIIRLKDVSTKKQKSKCLALYLASKTGKAILKAKSHKGTNSQIQLSKSDIGSIVIPRWEEKTIYKDYEKAWKAYNATLLAFGKTIDNMERNWSSYQSLT